MVRTLNYARGKEKYDNDFYFDIDLETGIVRCGGDKAELPDLMAIKAIVDIAINHRYYLLSEVDPPSPEAQLEEDDDII